MKKLTLKDIAKSFGVSISTVSKALNNSDEISEVTRLRIQKYAKMRNYKPNLNALSLKQSKTRTIGIIIPDMLDYFFAQVLKGIEKVALEHDYKVIICISNESYTKEIEIIEMLSYGSVDGFIVSISEETEIKKDFKHFETAIDFGLPVVMFDRVAENLDCDKVITNNSQAATDAVEKLVADGCKNIGFVSSTNHLKSSEDMLNGYLKGLEVKNLPTNKNLIVNTKEDHYSKYEDILTPLFDNPIDAVIATSESLAVAAMKIAQKKEMKVPEEFSIIGFSNGILARHSNPKLTTISQHGETMGIEAVNMILDKLEKRTESNNYSTRVIKTDIVERKSTIH